MWSSRKRSRDSSGSLPHGLYEDGWPEEMASSRGAGEPVLVRQDGGWDQSCMTIGIGAGVGDYSYPTFNKRVESISTVGDGQAQTTTRTKLVTEHHYLTSPHLSASPITLHPGDRPAKKTSAGTRRIEISGPGVVLHLTRMGSDVAVYSPPDDSWTDDFSVLQGPSSSSSVPSSAMISPSLDFGEVDLEPGSDETRFLAATQPQQGYLLGPYHSSAAQFQGECLSPYSTSASTGLSMSYEGALLEEPSREAWELVDGDGALRFGWQAGSGSPGAAQYTHTGDHISELVPAFGRSDVDMAAQQVVSWGPSPVFNTVPAEPTDLFGFDIAHVGAMATSPSNTSSAMAPDGLFVQAAPKLLEVPRAPPFLRRMSDPPPVTRPDVHSDAAAAAATGQRNRAHSTYVPSAYPSLQPQPLSLQARPAHEARASVPVARQSSRGKRTGPLPDAKKKAALKTRAEKSVCISCRHSKVSCQMVEGSESCLKCHRMTQNPKFPYVCTRAYFLELVYTNTTNYISQHSINHPVPRSEQRRRLDVPATINITKLLQLLERLRTDFRIRVSQGDEVLYDLDLGGCCEYLTALQPTLPSEYPFGTFIATQLSRADGWRSCVVDGAERMRELLTVLVAWNTAPSRVTYSLVREVLDEERPLDPDSAADRPILLAAAQLSRLVSRKIELLAYRELQSGLITSGSVSEDLLTHLAHVLLSLRWRLSWWAVLGDGRRCCENRIPEEEEEEEEVTSDLESTTARVRKLCKILYFYYCSLCRRPPCPPDHERPVQKTTRYADTQRAVDERFPEDESVDGFERWLIEGQDKVREAGAPEQVNAAGLL